MAMHGLGRYAIDIEGATPEWLRSSLEDLSRNQRELRERITSGVAEAAAEVERQFDHVLALAGL